MERLNLWDELRALVVGRTEAWIILGDFNNVLNSYERMGSEPVSGSETTLC